MVLEVLPGSFWISVGACVFALVAALLQIRRGVGLPMAAVVVTIIFWYIVDIFYNDYKRLYLYKFHPDILSEAWWQVSVFLFAFAVLAPLVNAVVNANLLRTRTSQIIKLTPKLVASRTFQDGLDRLLAVVFAAWVGILGLAVARYQTNFLGYIFPPLTGHPGPWVTSGLSSGLDSLWALTNYIQLMVGSLFGVIAALSKRPWTRRLAVMGVILTWPFYIFDRTRKFILLIAVPGIIAWALFRLRGNILKKGFVVIAAALLVNAWFGFIISNRLNGSIASSFQEGGFDFSSASEAEHQGLNMYEELAWIIHLRRVGTYQPGIGENYIANLVNPVPRVLWPSKPTIGLDYAIARGLGGGSGSAGVYATLSNGLVGQGVVNFGVYLGPLIAALLMAFWSAWLSKIDLQLDRIGYLPLYGLGLIITFTMGRDITLLEAYPFVFGYVLCTFWEKRARKGQKRDRLRARRGGNY